MDLRNLGCDIPSGTTQRWVHLKANKDDYLFSFHLILCETYQNKCVGGEGYIKLSLFQGYLY